MIIVMKQIATELYSANNFNYLFFFFTIINIIITLRY